MSIEDRVARLERRVDTLTDRNRTLEGRVTAQDRFIESAKWREAIEILRAESEEQVSG